MEENKIVCMDNLEYMRSLPSESIDLIYSDILYGTGRKFKDFQDLKSNKEIIEKFYKARIEEMHRILKDTGTIYLQMDTRINHWVRCIMDDIFGYKQFRNEIVWRYRRWTSPSKNFQKMHDVVLRYTKTDKWTWNQLYEPKSESTQKAFGNSKLTTEITDKGTVKKIKTEAISEGVNMSDVWEISMIQGSTSKEKVGYDTQKPLKLMERIIKASSNKGDVCADFFCGSGSFLVKANELERQITGCDINPRAVEITCNRINGFIYE